MRPGHDLRRLALAAQKVRNELEHPIEMFVAKVPAFSIPIERCAIVLFCLSRDEGVHLCHKLVLGGVRIQGGRGVDDQSISRTSANQVVLLPYERLEDIDGFVLARLCTGHDLYQSGEI